MNGMAVLNDLLVSCAALLGGAAAAILSDRCITSEENRQSLFAPEHCKICGRKLEFWDKVPLLSWLLNGGKCRFCGTAVSKREPILSFLHLVLWPIVFMIWLGQGTAAALTIVVSISCLICAAGLCWSGVGEQPVLLPLLLSMGILRLIQPDALRLSEHLFGALGMLGFCLILRFLPQRLRGQERLRLDTIAYLSCAGLICGWKSCFVVLPAAVLLGAVFAIFGKKKQKSLLRGPSQEKKYAADKPGRETPSLLLTGGAVVSLAFGRLLMNGYLALFSSIR